MNPSKQKGTRAETAVVKYLAAHGIEAHRKALSGAKDEGDIELPGLTMCLEVKTGKQTANYNRSQLKEWLRQAEEEAKNAQQECLLVIVRYQRKLTDAEVWTRLYPGKDRYAMQYLDTWVVGKKEV